MAPLADNLTPRVFIDYTSAGQAHTLQLRLFGGSTSADAITLYNEVTAILKAGMLTTDSFTGARFSAAGSNLSFPISVAAVVGTSSQTLDPANKPNFASWVGRSPQGRRVRVTFFTAALAEPPGYRSAPPPTGWPLSMFNYLELDAEGVVAVDGGIPIWNNYVNYGVNAHFQRKARRTNSG